MLINALSNKNINNNYLSAFICDYDGVIAKGDTEQIMEKCFEVISRYTYINKDTFTEIFSMLVPFKHEKSIDFLLDCLNIKDARDELLKNILKVDTGIKDALPFLKQCKETSIPVFILSSGTPDSKKMKHLAKHIDKKNIYADAGFSKININDYKRFIKNNSLIPKKCLYIDDCPAALSTAKAIGLNTVHMPNKVFPKTIHSSSIIDYSIENWDELIKLFSNSFKL